MSNQTAPGKNEKKQSGVPEVEVVQPDEVKNKPARQQRPSHEPLTEDELVDQAMAEAGIDEDFEDEEMPMIDEALVEHTCHQLFELSQSVGNHEVRRLARLVGQMGAAILGADPREFFPDAPPIRDANAPQGAPTFQGSPQPGWPAAHEAHGPQGGFQPTQPVMNANGQPAFHRMPEGGHQPMQPMAAPQPQHIPNPSGAEMRVVDDPTGTMQQGAPPQQFLQQPGQAHGAPQGQPRRRRRRR